MKMFKWLLGVSLAVGLIIGGAYIVHATCANSDIECFTIGGTQKYRVDASGNVEAAGTLAVTGAQTLTGATTFNGAVTANAAVTANNTVSLSTTTFTGSFLPWPRTIAQLNTLTPGATGQIVLCSDCARSAVCVSSGSHPTNSVGAWVVAVNTGTFIGSTFSGFAHCQ